MSQGKTKVKTEQEIEIMNELCIGSDAQWLQCANPMCKSTNLHLSSVNCLGKAESANLVFWCEGCDYTTTIGFDQHEGATEVSSCVSRKLEV